MRSMSGRSWKVPNLMFFILQMNGDCEAHQEVAFSTHFILMQFAAKTIKIKRVAACSQVRDPIVWLSAVCTL